MYITTTFAFTMIQNPSLATVRITELPLAAVKAMAPNLISRVPYDNQAIMLSKALDVTIPSTRVPISLQPGDSMINVNFLNISKKASTAMSISDANELVYGVDFDYRFYLVEVISNGVR